MNHASSSPIRTHAHGPCECAHHRVSARAPASTSTLQGLSALAPALACLVCPACLTTYAKAAGALGLGLVLSETHHLVFLVVSVVVALVSAAARFRVTRHAGPLAATMLGCALLVLDHALHESVASRAIVAGGLGALLVGGAWGHRLARAELRRTSAA